MKEIWKEEADQEITEKDLIQESNKILIRKMRRRRSSSSIEVKKRRRSPS